MKQHTSQLARASLIFIGALFVATTASAQVAGGTTSFDATITASTQIAMGWSVKHTLMDQTIYNEEGQKVGAVDDLIIAPDRNVSYVIVGAGGFIGIGRHDVAIPVSQIQERDGKLVMPGVTKEMVKAMPEFEYAGDTAKRDAFVAMVTGEITRGKATMADLQAKAGEATADVKSAIERQLTTLQDNLQLAETKLNEMTQAAAMRWREFETDVGAATARLRKSIESATS